MSFARWIDAVIVDAVGGVMRRAAAGARDAVCRKGGARRPPHQGLWAAEALEPRRLLSGTPLVLSLNRSSPAGPNTGAVSVSYTATFNQGVTGVDPTDFTIVTAGSLVTAPAVSVSGSGAIYTVTVGGLRGTGTVRLDLIDDDTITASGVPLGGAGAHNGSFQGQTYDILQVYPQVLSINRTTPSTSTTSASSVGYTVTFSEVVSGVDASDFQVTATTGLTHAAPVVSGSGAVYTVTIGSLAGAGTLGFNLVDNGSIHDANGRPLASSGPASFAPESTFVSGATPSSFVSADFNGDGRVDVAVADQSGNVVSILLGNGDGTFKAPVTIAAGGSPSAIASTDVNGDGRPDLLVTNYTSGSVSVLLGNGDGTFKAAATFATQGKPSFVTFADLNNDGRPDLIVASTEGDTVSALLGNGDGTFQADKVFDDLALPTSVTSGDFNGDGKTDLAISAEAPVGLTVLLGNGDGTFRQPLATYAAGNDAQSVVATDLNSDGKTDLIVSDLGDLTVSVFVGNGDGTFQPRATFVTGSGPDGVASADLNLDGKPDVIVAGSLSAAVSLLPGNADGTFQDPGTFGTSSFSASNQVTSADANGDGKPDLIVSNVASGGAWTAGIVLNNSNGSFAGEQYYVSAQPVFSAHYDFGTSTSPVQAGYARVSDATIFSSAQGFGWLAAPAGSRDRGAVSGTTPLTQDFDFVNSTGSTFAVNLPNGAYNVTVTMGDATTKRDKEGVYLQGAQVDTVTTAAGQFYVKTYAVTVNNGQLTLLLKDLGGTDGFTVINGLDIARAAYTAHYDFGTPTSPVAAGTAGVNEQTAYNPQQGYGWLTAPGGSIDRGSPNVPIATTDLTRDFDYAAPGGSTFAVDVPNGTYNVTVTMGDAAAVHAGESLSFNGVSYDASIATNADRWLVTTYSVVVAGGQLVVRLNANNSAYSAIINGLDIVPAAFTAHYDFGPASSPTAAGAAPVSESTSFNAAQGYGWLTAPLGSRDRGGLVGTTPITRDWDYAGSGGATFAVNVPNGNYDVTVTMGDATTAHDDQAVFVQGAQVASVNTAAGQYLSQVSPATVSNGQLTVGIKDLGGSDPNAVIDGLDIAAVLPGGNFDFGTPTSPVLSGAIGVSEQTLYTPQQGYGWVDAPVGSRDRGAVAGTTALTQDFDFTDGLTTQGPGPLGSTFLVDLPNGTYNVTVTMGDASQKRDDEGIYLQGALVDTVTTSAGQYFVKTYAVAVSNGQLNLTLRDLGISHDPYTVINGLNIVAA